MSKRKRKLSKAEAGRIGGRMTARRHGIEHYRAAGRKGFMVTVARHWAGDHEGYLRWLRARGWLQDLQRAFAASGQTCIEIPPIPGLDDQEDTP
jgi:general stress protein YciG